MVCVLTGHLEFNEVSFCVSFPFSSQQKNTLFGVFTFHVEKAMFTATRDISSDRTKCNVSMTRTHIRKLLKEEEGLFDQHFGSFSNNEAKVPEKLIREVVQKSKRMFFVSDDGFLWLNLPNEKSITVVESLTAYMAHRRYGTEAIKEVIDHGSFDISRLHQLGGLNASDAYF